MRSLGLILTATFAAFGGLLVAGLLSHQQLDPGSLQRLCGETAGCAKVLASRYARIGPLPLSVIGAAFYAVMLTSLLACLGLGKGRWRGWTLRILLLLGTAGIAASAVLMVLQFFVIRAICPLCMLSAVFAGTIGVLAWRVWRRPQWHGEPGLAIGLLGLFIATGALAAYAAMQGRATNRPAGGQVLARVDGVAITADQIDPDTARQAMELETRLYDLRSEWVQRRVDQALIEREALARGLTVDELIQREIDQKIGPAVEALDRWLAEQRQRDKDFPWYSAQSRGMDEIRRNRRAEWLASLRAGRDIQVLLPRPEGIPLRIDPALVHRLGPENAPIRLTLFSDFECPYCAELAGVIQRIMETFILEVSLEYVHLPMKFHKQAFDAAVASEAAARQGKFWLYHDELMKQRGELDGKWEQAAQAVGLDLERFRADMASPDIRDRIERSRQVGQNLGLDGVPVLYLNARRVGGLLSVEELTQLIKLERRKLERP